MMKGIIVSWMLTATLAASALSILAQQDDGPILRPKKPTTNTVGATLIVLCDLACDWKLDGEAKGRIDAGKSAKAKVKIGRHLVIAATEDGLDQVQEFAQLEKNGQTAVTIELKPVREARLKTEQEARTKEAHDQEEKRRVEEQAERDLQAREQKARARAAQEEVDRQAEALYKARRFGEAIPLLDKSCTGGSPEACEKLGSVYDEGKGVTKDYSRAVALFSKSCDAGSPYGCDRFGAMYGNGKGLAKDEPKAVALFSKACDAGSAEGCNDLGSMYLTGRGVGRNRSSAECNTYIDSCSLAQDYPKAVTLFSKACDAGVADGCSNLGLMYLRGYGVAEDDSQALTLYLRACDAGSADGCDNVGIVYREGYGVPKDKTKARQFFGKSCSLGSKIGCDALKKLR